MCTRAFVTLGMFIVDEFSFMNEDGGGGTYAAIGARIWLQPSEIGMIVDEGHDFPEPIKKRLVEYGEDMWMFRPQPHCQTTRALNSYRGELRGFEYSTPRIRITPKDLEGTKLEKPKILHFICSPDRASAIMSEVEDIWKPVTVFEPIPDRCVPEELPALRKVLPLIAVLSPNAEEALSLLSLHGSHSKALIEKAADQFLDFGVGEKNGGWIIIRSGPLGAYLKSRATRGRWIEAFWTPDDANMIVDVTGAGNSFLGGFAAGMVLSGGDVYEATLYATVSASFIIEQEGLPKISIETLGGWNGDRPARRLEMLRKRHEGNSD